MSFFRTFLEALFRLVSGFSLSDTLYSLLEQKPSSLLDVGCGKGCIINELLRRGKKIENSHLIGMDIFPPYLREAKSRYHDLVLCDTRFLPVRPRSIDVVLALDTVEHLEKSDGFRLIEKMESIAVSQTIVYTPVGFYAKSHLEDNNPWQAHKSGWYPVYFRSRGYKVLGISGLKSLYGEGHEFRSKHRFFFPLLLGMALFTQFFTFKFVNVAYQMLCVKEYIKEDLKKIYFSSSIWWLT